MTVSGVFVVEIGGAALSADVQALLVSAHVDDSAHLPDLFLLRFRDPGRVVLTAAKAEIGAKVKISAVGPDNAAAEPLIEGEVTALEAEFDSTGTFTVIRGYDESHRLFRGRHTETYLQVTASDVARKVAGRAGLPIGTVESSTTVFDHVSQGGVSDWEFLDGLARESGYEIGVADGKFHFRKPKTASDAPAAGGAAGAAHPLVLRLGTDLLRFRCVLTSAEQVKEVQVRGWDVSQKKAIVATQPAATNGAALPTVTPVALAKLFGGRTYVSTDAPYGKQSEVDAVAKALAEEISGAFAQFKGIARGNPKLRANAAISVDNLGAPFDGKYTITSSRHSYDAAAGYTTTFSVTGRQERSLLGLASSGGSRRAAGVVVAQVSDARDPQDEGRVKVTFPWLSDTYVSDWVRTVQLGAGADRGAMVVPEVGDEVLVAFEQGDVRRPYVLGGLYNGVDKPPSGAVPVIDSASGKVNRRTWVSRRGHRIDLFDQDGRKEGITVSGGAGKVLLELDVTGTKVTVHSDGTVLVEGKKGVVVDAGSGKLELKGQEIALTAATGVKVSAGTALELKGATAKLESSATTEVKGGALCNISAALVKIN